MIVSSCKETLMSCRSRLEAQKLYITMNNQAYSVLSDHDEQQITSLWRMTAQREKLNSSSNFSFYMLMSPPSNLTQILIYPTIHFRSPFDLYERFSWTSVSCTSDDVSEQNIEKSFFSSCFVQFSSLCERASYGWS